jgi:hypothetical protein
MHLITLPEFARVASSAEDFLARVDRNGSSHEKGREYLDLIQKFYNDAAHRELAFEELWRFTRCCHSNPAHASSSQGFWAKGNM